ncbi:MAG: V-type H(+)-translocating pyrophosphatase [Chloroflexia bacterium]
MEQATLFERGGLWGVLATAVLALLYAFWLARQILREDTGTQRMKDVAWAIRDGANAYLRRQFRSLLLLIVILVFGLYLTAALAGQHWTVSIGRAAAFLMGALFSAAVGYIGMNMAVQGNIRVASAARRSFADALRIAYRTGTITGMLTDGLGLLGGTAIFMIYWEKAPEVLLGFGFGGTLLALFMRVGGGIYTKAADVGADLVGKVEVGIPEDDPRNAAVIADLVGDNVGDCAGMAADIFESYEVTIVSAMILGLAIQPFSLKWIVFPLLVRAIGVISSIIGTYAVSWWPTKGDAFRAMDLSYDLSSLISTASFFLLAHFYVGDLRVFAATAAGILLAVGFNKFTAYFTHPKNAPVKEIARSSRTGAATNLLTGLSVGYESTVWAILIIAATILLAVFIYTVQVGRAVSTGILIGGAVLALLAGFYFYRRTRHIELGIFSALGVLVVAVIIASFSTEGMTLQSRITFILYSVSLAGIGMLSHTGNNVSMDAFGPIADNAGGIGEMADLEPQARQILAELDAVGNTTKAITKGIAIASAVIAAVSLFGAYITDIGKVAQEVGAEALRVIDVADPMVFIGLLIGGAMPFLFSALTIRAVGRAAGLIVEEVRRQFRIPGVLEWKVKPDYARAVTICTAAAQKELVSLGLLAVLTPIIVGFFLKEAALGGFLAGVIVVGQLLAVFMANAGGAWDNAKKVIEDGWYGGKRSEAHRAAVVGDTVGDPLKDTAGPALNPMIKVINLVSLLVAPLIVRLGKEAHLQPYIYAAAGVGLAVVIAAILYSKKEIGFGVDQEVLATDEALEVQMRARSRRPEE